MATTEPTTTSAPAAPFWARGPLGGSAKAVHLWTATEPYTWETRCGNYEIAERKPDGEPSGNRCPACIDVERREAEAHADPPRRSTPAPAADPADDLGVIRERLSLELRGWTFEPSQDGWRAVHSEMQLATPGVVTVALAIRGAQLLEETYLQSPTAPIGYDPGLAAERQRREAEGWTFHSRLTSRPGHVNGVVVWHVDHPAHRQAGLLRTEIYGTLEDVLRKVGTMSTSTESLPLDHLFARTGPERQEVRRDVIVVGRYQPRKTFDQAKLEQLAASIREHGILNPLQVFQNERGQLELIAGERRLRAAELAGLETVPVDVKAYTLAQIHEISLIDNLQREDLSEVEEGLAYERLIVELGLSENKLAQRLGKSRGHIQQRRALAKAAPEVQQALADGKLSLTQARAIALAAPGDHGVQLQSLHEVERDRKLGTATNEERIREKTVQIAAETHKKVLKGLGWKILVEEYSFKPPIVWSKTDRPRPWTGAEIIKTAQDKTRPSAGDAASGELSASEKTILSARLGTTGFVSAKYVPWIAVSTKGNTWEYLTPAEAAALASEYQREHDDAAARYAAHGWTLTLRDGGSWNATPPEPAGKEAEFMWNWPQVPALLKRIEAGYSGKVTGATATTGRSGCACGAPWTYWDGVARIGRCADCQRAEEAKDAEAQAAIRAQLALDADWTRAVPIDLARLLVLSTLRISERLGMDNSNRDSKLQAVNVATDQQIRDALLDVLQACVWSWKDTALAQRYLPTETAEQPAETPA